MTESIRLNCVGNIVLVFLTQQEPLSNWLDHSISKQQPRSPQIGRLHKFIQTDRRMNNRKTICRLKTICFDWPFCRRVSRGFSVTSTKFKKQIVSFNIFSFSYSIHRFPFVKSSSRPDKTWTCCWSIYSWTINGRNVNLMGFCVFEEALPDLFLVKFLL